MIDNFKLKDISQNLLSSQISKSGNICSRQRYLRVCFVRTKAVKQVNTSGLTD